MIAVLGHVTRDLVRRGDEPPRTQPGGAAWYASMALAAFGARVTLVTRLAPEDAGELLAAPRQAGVELRVLGSDVTTVFENRYEGEGLGRRVQHLRAVAEPLGAADLDGLSPDAWLLGPVTPGELPEAVFVECRRRGGWLAADAQGLLRAAQDGEVVPRVAPALEPILAQLDLLKVSDGEAELLVPDAPPHERPARLAARGPREVAVTRGAEGADVHAAGSTLHVPAAPAARVVDPTGCGDTWLAAFLWSRLGGEPVARAGPFAAAAAAAKLGSAGPLRAERLGPRG